MADVSRRRPYIKSAKRRADAISFLSNISLDGSVAAKPSPRAVSQRQKDDETNCGLSKKDEDKQGTSGRKNLTPLPDETKDTVRSPGAGSSQNRLLPAELTGTPRSSSVQYSRSVNVGHASSRSASLTPTVKNHLNLGRTRRLSGAGEKSPPVSPQKFDINKQRSVSITTSELPSKRKLFQQFSYDPSETLGEHSLQLRAHGLRLRNVSITTAEPPREKSPVPAKVVMVKAIPRPSSSDSGRFLLLSHNYKAPFAVFSYLRYGKNRYSGHSRTDSDGSHPLNRTRKSSGNKPIQVGSEGYLASLEGVELGDDNRTVSYSHFLVPTRELSIYRRQMSLEILGVQSPHSPAVRKIQGHPLVNIAASAIQLDRGDSENVEYISNLPVYDPNELDDPELSAGKHRKLLTFPSYMVSVVDYTKPSELKKDVNQKFKEKYPHIDLTLSKLRSIKREMKKIILDECSLDALTLAQAYAIFEKLVLMGKINKPNRKLVAGACMVLAAKLNDIKGQDLENLFKELEDTFRESRKDVFSLEFPILVALEFSLHLPEHEVLPHYRRIVQLS